MSSGTGRPTNEKSAYSDDQKSIVCMMRRRLPPLNPLKSAESAARHASFLLASEELGVTPSAISRQVRALEDHLGVDLFVRGHRQVETTPEGRAYLNEIADALDRIAAATARIASPGRRGVLAVAAYPTFAIRWLVPRWGRFYDLHPEIDVQLTTTLAPVDFARDPFDAAIRVGDGDWPGCGSLRLCDVAMFPVCSPALLEHGPPLDTPADLGRHVLLHSVPRPRDWERWLEAAGATGVDAEAGLRFDSLSLAFQAAIEGIGVAVGIEALVADDLARGRLVRPFAAARDSSRPFHLVWPTRKANDPRLRAFVDWLVAEVAAARR